MKNLLIILAVFVLAAGNSQKKYSEFDISYSKSGGFSPIYENLLLNGKNVHYSFEGHGKNIKKDFKITDAERKVIEDAITKNNFRTIQEDNKKLYDYIATSINVKYGSQSASKSDGSYIMPQDPTRWDNVVKVFTDLIKAKNLNP